MVLDGHLWKSRESTAPLPYDSGDILNGSPNVDDRAGEFVGVPTPSGRRSTDSMTGHSQDEG